MVDSTLERMKESGGVPEVGQGVTIFYFSDRRVGTVIEVLPFKSGPNKGLPRIARVQEDTVSVVSGSTHDGSAVYRYDRNPEGFVFNLTWTGLRWKGTGSGIAFGVRDQYTDPHF